MTAAVDTWSEPPGQLVCTITTFRSGRPDQLRIDRADAIVEIDGAFLDLIAEGRSPFITFDPVSRALIITGTNSEVVYRVSRHLTSLGTYRAEWPD